MSGISVLGESELLLYRREGGYSVSGIGIITSSRLFMKYSFIDFAL